MSVRNKFQFFLASSLVLSAVPSWAQVSASTGAVRGTIIDSSGGVVPHIPVKLTNPLLAIEKTVTTDDAGVFAFPLLQPSSGYQVEVATQGYEQSVFKNITVRVTETTVINAKLVIGTQSEVVSVSADEQLINTTNATLGAVVGTRVLTSLPLATRNVFDIASTDAGTYSAFTSPAATVAQGGNAIYVGGQRSTNNDYRLNGIESTNVEFHTLAAGAIPIPSPDAVQEFRTQTSLYDATTAYGSGGVINLVTRSGTNQYHGVVYDFLRNTVLNANDYFLKYSQAHPAIGAPTNKAPIMLQNLFGGSVGGRIPKLRTTFFFVNYEGLRQKNGSTGFVSGLIPVLPASRDAASLASAFGLPVQSIDPVAVNLLNAKGPLGGYLLPQASGTVGTLGQYAASGPVILNTDQVSSRLDHTFQIKGQDNRLSIAYFWSNGLFINPAGLSNSPGQAYDYPLGNKNLSLIDTHTFSSKVINEAVYGFNWTKRDIEAYGRGVLLADVGMTRYNASFFPTLPSFSFSDGSLGAFGYGGNIGRYQHTNQVNFRDTVSVVVNKHNLRLGFETIKEQFNESPQASPGGSLAFNTVVANTVAGAVNYSSNLSRNLAIRDFLIGAPFTISGNTGLQRFHLRDTSYSAFAQDDYRVAPRLTLNLGLRYDFFGNPTEINNLLANFDPSRLSATTRLTGGNSLRDGLILAGVNGSRTTLASSSGNWSPRVGFAWDPLGNAKLALHGGFGLYFQATNTMQTQLINNPPFYLTATQNNNTTIVGLSNPFGSLNLPQPSAFPLYPTFQTQTGVSATGAPVFANNGGVPVALRGVAPNNRTPYAENWNLTAEYEFIPKWTLNVGYLGSNGVRQSAGLNLNNALLVNAANPGRFGLTSNSAANRESRVPIAGISSTNFNTIVNGAFSSYNALLVTVTHRLVDNFLIKAAYTHAKSLDNFPASEGTAAGGSSQLGNQFSFGLNKGSSMQDIPHRLVVTYVWDLPWFRDNKKLDFVLGHWSLAGITTYQSGAVGTITQSIGATSLTGTSGYGLITGNLKNVGSPQSNNTAGKVQYLNTANVSTQPLLASGSSISSTTSLLTPGSDSFSISGNGGRVIGSATRGAFHGPMQYRWDTTLSKNFPVRILGDAGNLEFRAEAFKIFNNTIFDLPNAVAGSASFGQITNTTDTTGRQLQFAIKASF